jgi:hypothetical protein
VHIAVAVAVAVAVAALVGVDFVALAHAHLRPLQLRLQLSRDLPTTAHQSVKANTTTTTAHTSMTACCDDGTVGVMTADARDALPSELEKRLLKIALSCSAVLFLTPLQT